jgi:ribose transport system permease protein
VTTNQTTTLPVERVGAGGKALQFVFTYSALVVFVAVFVVFSLLSDKFLETRNLLNILTQSSAIGIVAIGITFVLLVAGIDLSVGSVMFLSAAVAAKLLASGFPLWCGFLAMAVVGLAVGLFNGFISTRFAVPAFLVTLAVLYMGRGFGLLLTETRQVALPEGFLAIGQARVLGIPLPVLVFAVVLIAAHYTLTRTPFGRHLYAIGNNREAAEKAGIRVRPILISAFAISGLAAGIGGMVAVAQLGAVAPNFAEERELVVIAAAVLGGTSLFGGRGAVFPGTVFGAVLLLTIENGLNLINANPYVYPLITASVIFLAVLVDSVRTGQLAKLNKRKIRVEHK